jgi:predicted regulator of Ras-like GTPase activity (Roadblock/LC7/MglB family)
MSTLPQLIEEDIQEIEAALLDALAKSEADAALLLDKGGFLITRVGGTERFDATTLGALAAGSFAATQGVAQLVGENDFNCVYQQGARSSVIVHNVDDQTLLVIVFKAQVSAGAVKYHAAAAIERVTAQLRVARRRSPDQGIDLSVLNLADTAVLFRRKTA